MIEALRADAAWLRHAAATSERRALLEGRDPRASKGAVWSDSDEARVERKTELERAVLAYRREWGHHPSEAQLAAFIQERNRERNAA